MKSYGVVTDSLGKWYISLSLILIGPPGGLALTGNFFYIYIFSMPGLSVCSTCVV